MKTRFLHIMLAVFLQLTGVVYAQIDSTKSLFDTADSLDLTLPSLEESIEMALAHSLLIHNQELVIEQSKVKFDVDKKLIQRALTFNSQYSIGNNQAVINNQLLSGVPYTAATATNFYSAGIFLNISAFQITARKKQLELSKLDIALAEDLLNQFQTRIKLEVKQKYTELIKQKNILKLRMDAVSSARLAKEFTERDFQSGDKPMSALSNANEAYTKLSIALEQSYAAYVSALYEFQTLIGKQ